VTPKGEIDHKGTNQSQVGNSLVNHSEASRKSQLAKWDGMSEWSTWIDQVNDNGMPGKGNWAAVRIINGVR
jgi:hypothetical protein